MTRDHPDIDAIIDAAGRCYLDIVGIVLPKSDDPVPAGTKSIVLFGPSEPGFWAQITAQPEFLDGDPDPVDRWSRRVVTGIAGDVGGVALFPFDGPPYVPFLAWALRSGRAWASPVMLLVHETAGVFLSFRGALCLPYQLDQPVQPEKPCKACVAQPCITACPVGALGPEGYDLDACHDYLGTQAGRECMENGCAVRRACPVSQSYARLPEQSAHHMKAFHP